MHSIKNILCVVGTDETAKQALQHAVAIAETQQASLILLTDTR